MEELGAVGTAELPTLGTLTLFASRGIFSPDSDISGRVELNLNRRVLLRGLWVKFTGINTVNINGNVSKSDLLSTHEDYYLGGLHDVLMGFGEERDSSNDSTYLEILEGSHQWNYHFKVPSDAPFSYCDDVSEVLYTLTVILDTPMMPMSVSQVILIQTYLTASLIPYQLINFLIEICALYVLCSIYKGHTQHHRW
jgi:hypothetical protein